MARSPNRTVAAEARNGRIVVNAARTVADRLRPEIEQLHRHADRVVNDRQRLIESITDPSLRRTVR